MKPKKIIQLLGLVLLIFLITLAIPASNDNSVEVKNSDMPLMTSAPVIGSYTPPAPGQVYDVEIAGDVLYAATRDSGLRVLDISDPMNPTEIGSYNETNDDDIVYLVIAGDVLFMTNYTHLTSINISDPTNPTRIGIVNPAGINMIDMEISGDVMYLSKGLNGFDSWDISDPANPTILDAEGSPVRAVGVSGDIAVGVETNQISIFNVSNPAAISEITNIPVTATLNSGCVAFHGNIAYVGSKDTGQRLLAIDLSDPTQPVVLFNDTSINAYCIAIAGDLAYVGCGAGGLKCFDISDPSNPIELASLTSIDVGTVWDVEFAGDVLYTGSQTSAKIIRIGEPLNPPINEAFVDNAGSSSQNIAVAGDVAYYGSFVGSYGFYAYNISDPTTTPVYLDNVWIWGAVVDIAIAGQVAYLTNWTQGLVTVNISDPANLAIIGNLPITSANVFSSIAVAGDVAYLGSGVNLFSVDISDPTNPIQLDSLPVGGSVNDLAVAGDVLYAAAYAQGFQCINITDPADLNVIGSLQTGLGSIDAVAVAGDVAYLGNGTDGLATVDISDPTSPSILGGMDLLGTAKKIALSGDVACVASGATDLNTVDISDPSNPQLIGSLDWIIGYGYAVTVAGDFAILGDSNRDIVTVRIRQAGTYDSDTDGLSYIEEVWTYNTDPNVNNTPWADDPPSTTMPVNSDYNITWELYTLNSTGGFYRVDSNSASTRDWTPWTNDTEIEMPAYTSTLGNFWYTIEYNNSLGLLGANDTVWININDNTTPWEGNTPSDAVYEWIEAATPINWQLYDNYDYGNYRVLLNTTTVLQGWTSWSSNGTNVFETPDTSSALGVFNYSIEFTDGTGNLALDEVIITVQDTTAPWAMVGPVPPLPLNSNYDLTWQLYDNVNPGGEGWYRVTSNSTYTGNWTQWVYSTGPTISVNTTTVGVFSYLITFNDSVGNPNTNEVLVTVYDGTAPWDDNPADRELLIGAVETLQWLLSDNYDPGAGAWGYFRVISNQTDASIGWTAWNANNTLTTPVIDINTSIATVWEYILEYNDSVGNPSTDTVYIRVIPAGTPDDGGIPGFEMLFVFSALIAIAFYQVKKKRIPL